MGTFREYSLATRKWHLTLLSDQDRAFLRQMPTLHWFECEGKHVRMAHATPQGDLFEYLDRVQWGERVAELADDLVLLGHTHVQGMKTFGKITVVNPGSVGLARDHPGKACYAVFRDGQVELKQVPYEVGRAAALLRAAPLSRRVIAGLVGVLGHEA